MSRIVDEQQREIAALCRLADLTGRQVLDVGCGDGRVTLRIAELADAVVGVDPDAKAIERARRQTLDAGRTSVSFIAEDVNTISAPWLRAFDVVVFSRSL